MLIQSNCGELFKPKLQLAVCASTGGLRADFNENLAKHASSSYDFGRTYVSR